jgi:hypothetical protein
VKHALRNCEPLARCQLYSPVFEIDDEQAIDDVEKLVVAVMLVPVEIAVYHAEGTTLSLTRQSV